jgi:hypothetical protein
VETASDTKKRVLEMVSFTAWRGKKVLDKLSDIAQRIILDQDQTRLKVMAGHD